MAAIQLSPITTYMSHVSLLLDTNASNDAKVKALQKINTDLEVIIGYSNYPQFLNFAVETFVKVLKTGEPSFMIGDPVQVQRTLILQIIHRFPVDEHLKSHARILITTMLQIFQDENEQCALICLRMLSDLEKVYHLLLASEVTILLRFINTAYKAFPGYIHTMFEQRPPVIFKNSEIISIEPILNTACITTPFYVEDKSNKKTQFDVLPRVTLSLKVYAEFPAILLMLQSRKASVHEDIAFAIIFIVLVIRLRPPRDCRNDDRKKVLFHFICVQVNSLTFLANAVSTHKEIIKIHSNNLVSGILQLFRHCPVELVHSRRDLLMALKQILSTELRNAFVGSMEELLDETVLIGNGWSVKEHLRPLAYSIMAEHLHYVRDQLSFKDLTKAVTMFSEFLHDESSSIALQAMACKILLNLVDYIPRKADGATKGFDLLLKLLEVLVLKCKNLTKVQLPILRKTCQIQNKKLPNVALSPNVITSVPLTLQSSSSMSSSFSEDASSQASQSSVATPPSQRSNTESRRDSIASTPMSRFPESEKANCDKSCCQNLLKLLIHCVKAIACNMDKMPKNQIEISTFQQKETHIYMRFMKYAFQAFDLFTVPVIPSCTISKKATLSQEQKDIVDTFATVFGFLHPSIFREIFTVMIDCIVNRMLENPALQTLANSLLATQSTSANFASILLEYLLERMKEMGSNKNLSDSYLIFFKLVFGSVSLFQSQNEMILKSYLHQIVNKSMEFALVAADPLNYFLILRALFRFIGGGCYPQLYEEMLILLPNLLRRLVQFQSCPQLKYMKDTLTELCLNIPIKLNILGQYLPLLMGPLISGLNGSDSLVIQALQTLEICLDELERKDLHDNMDHMRSELMPAIWQHLSNPDDSIAEIAFKVLGKLGGESRNLTRVIQKLNYIESTDEGPSIKVDFINKEIRSSIALPVGKIIETASENLRLQSIDLFYQRQCWEIIQGFLTANISQGSSSEDIHWLLSKLNSEELKPIEIPLYQCSDLQARKIHITAMASMYYGLTIEKLKPKVLPFMKNVIRHYALLIVVQQSGIFCNRFRMVESHGMDPLIIIDTVAAVVKQGKELRKPGRDGLKLILDSVATFVSSKPRASELPFYKYLAEKMSALCYERACSAKIGGCVAIKLLIEKYPPKALYMHLCMFTKALLFVIMDLEDEVSFGAVDTAKNILEKLFEKYGTPISPDNNSKDLLEEQEKALNGVAQELFRNIMIPNTYAQQQVIHLLKLLADVSNKCVAAVIEPFRDLIGMIPPKSALQMQPLDAQIGILNGITFCLSLPTLPNGKKLFQIDSELPHYQRLLQELIFICKSTDADLKLRSSYKLIADFIPLRKAALQTLVVLWNLVDQRPLIFNTCFQALTSSSLDLQEIAFNCLKQLDETSKTEMQLKEAELTTLMDPRLTKQKSAELKQDGEKKQDMIRKAVCNFLKDFGNLTKADLRMQQLDYVVQLYPASFSKTFCEKLFQCLQRWLELFAVDEDKKEEKNLCIAVIDIFQKVPAISKAKIKPLLLMLMDRTPSVKMEVAGCLYESVIRFLQCDPLQTMEYFLQEKTSLNVKACLFLKNLLKGDNGEPFREVLKIAPLKDQLIQLAFGNLSRSFRNSISVSPQMSIVLAIRRKVQYLGISIISFLIQYDDNWFSQERSLLTNLQGLWISTISSIHYFAAEGVDFMQWNEPKMLVKCFLNFARHNPNEIKFLFHLLRAFTGKFISDFEFLKDFFKNTVAKQYSAKWKRSAFFAFVTVFRDGSFPVDLKAKILQYVLIPSFAIAFENGEELALMRGDPLVDASSEQNCPANIVSVFIDQVINPDAPLESSKALCVPLCQFSCLLVENASRHIGSVDINGESSKLKRLWKYAQFERREIFLDPAVASHRLLLASHIAAKFHINSSLTEQILQRLLRSHAAVAWAVAKQALDILIEALPGRIVDGNKKLIYWTKRIIVEEGCALTKLANLLQVLVQYQKIYYCAHHLFINDMVGFLLKLDNSPNPKHKKLGVDVAEVIIQWKLQRCAENEENEQSFKNQCMDISESFSTIAKNNSDDITGRSLPKKARINTGTCPKPKPRRDFINQSHSDQIVDFLVRTACQVSNTEAEPLDSTLPQRCICLLKIGLQELWPDAKLNTLYINVLLQTVGGRGEQPNFANVSAALDLLTNLLTILKKETVPFLFQSLLLGISACLICSDSKVANSTHNLLKHLMSLFPPKPERLFVSTKAKELHVLYMTIYNKICNCLRKYERSVCSSAELHNALLMLRAVSLNHSCYVSCLLRPLMSVVVKVFRRHIEPVGEPNELDANILILSFELLESQIAVMPEDMRKTFIGNVLVGLIQKSPSPNVLKAIVGMVEYWVKCNNENPSLQEESILLVKMMQFIENRFPNEPELNAQFLNLVHYIYSDVFLKQTDLPSKLECAFMSGMRCTQPLVRAQFFKVYSCALSRLLPERLLYIICSQNWSSMGPHFYIKQCIELLFATAVEDSTIQSPTMEFMLPSLTSVLGKTVLKVDSIGAVSVEATNEEQVHIKCSKKRERRKSESATTSEVTQSSQEQVNVSLSNHVQFLESLKVMKTDNFLTAVAQLCHIDTALARHVWLMLFPRLWAILPEGHQVTISAHIQPFLTSGIHVLQKHCHPSVTGVFAEGVMQCVPRVSLDAQVLSYLGKSHNAWYQSAIVLEELSFEQNVNESGQSSTASKSDPTKNRAHPELYITPQQQALDNLSDLYSQLKEEDLLCALWQRRSPTPKIVLASQFEQQGLFHPAREAYFDHIGTTCQEGNEIPASMQSECNFLLTHNLRCWKELNDWENICEYNSKSNTSDPYMELENCWQGQVWNYEKDWTPMRDALKVVDDKYPEENYWKVKYYKGHLAIQSYDNDISRMGGLAQMASNLCIKEWRCFPSIISYCHLPILQAAHQIVELQEAVQMHQIGLSYHPDDAAATCNFIMMMKTWENRPPALSDDFSYWNDLLIWRQLFCQKMLRRYNPNVPLTDNQSLQLSLWNDALAQSYTQVIKIARKHGFLSLSLDILQKVGALENIPVQASFRNLIEEYKCCLQMAYNTRKHNPDEANRILTNAISIINGGKGECLTKEMLEKVFVFHGMFYNEMGKPEEATKAFAASARLNDDSEKVWAEWGNFLEQKFIAGKSIGIGKEVLTCFIHACKHQDEAKSRTCIAKILWLLTFDDEEMSLATNLQKLSKMVPLVNWIPWIPQLISCLTLNEGSKIVDIINAVGSAYPQVVYFPLRTLYYTLKMENRESGEAAATNDCSQAKSALLLCNRAIVFLKGRKPGITAVLDSITDQMYCLQEGIFEKAFGQLRQALAQCYSTFFEQAVTGVETVVTPQLLKIIGKTASKFLAGLEKGSTQQKIPTVFESPAGKVRESAKGSYLKKALQEFSDDFNFSGSDAMKINDLIMKLLKWIKIMELKFEFLPSSFLMDQKFRFLTNFSEKTANIELPGDVLMPKFHHVYIAQFMPHVDAVYKQNAPARRIYIRGTDGKVYPYLVFNNGDDLSRAHHEEERVLQLLRMLDVYLKKQKETSRRFLAFTIPKVVSLTPRTYLVEDNVSSISLLDIFKQICKGRKIDTNVLMFNFYERLAAFQFSGKPLGHKLLCDHFKYTESVVRRNSLKNWVERTYLDAADYWAFRKQFTVQLSMIAFVEYVLHLVRLNPGMMYIHRDSGLMNVLYFKFDVDHDTGELNTSQPVPFRLTPNITEFMTPLGVSGPFTASMIAAARCLVHPNYHITSLLRAFLRDEVIAGCRKKCCNSTDPTKIEGEAIIRMVTKAVSAITTRLESLTDIGPNAQAQKLVDIATSTDNLCRMDLRWQPWL